MASGRNLLCRPRQGGRGSHEQTMLEKDFILSQPILEGFVEAPTWAFSGLPHGADLACEVPLDSGNCRSLWRQQHRRPSSFSEKCSAGLRRASRGASKLLSDDDPRTARRPFDSRTIPWLQEKANISKAWGCIIRPKGFKMVCVTIRQDQGNWLRMMSEKTGKRLSQLGREATEYYLSEKNEDDFE